MIIIVCSRLSLTIFLRPKKKMISIIGGHLVESEKESYLVKSKKITANLTNTNVIVATFWTCFFSLLKANKILTKFLLLGPVE